MALEIERKFLTACAPPLAGLVGIPIVQGYLAKQAAVVRVRIAGDRAFLTIKGPSSGLTRDEYEYEIPLADGRELLGYCVLGVLSKTRYLVPANRHTFEVDVYHGHLEGLVTAEVELASETENVELPSWLGKEVSDDRRYGNSSLAGASGPPV